MKEKRINTIKITFTLSFLGALRWMFISLIRHFAESIGDEILEPLLDT